MPGFELMSAGILREAHTGLRKDSAEESTLAWLCGLGGSQDFHRPADADGFVFDLAYQRLGTRENTAASGRLELCAQRV